jgi:hypothetical protein
MRQMPRHPGRPARRASGPAFAVLSACLALAACTVSTARLAEVQSSTQYDNVPCEQLVAERDALAAQYDLPVDYRREGTIERSRLLPDLDFVSPDLRGASARQWDEARGRLSAINGSIRRRSCET